LLLDPSGLDFAIERLFTSTGLGFIGKHSFWLEDILHDRAKQLVIVPACWRLLAQSSAFPTRLRVRRSLGFLVLALAVSTSIVTPLKLTAVLWA
jgi:membrane-associated PAP2 superfamily phosphatase